MYRVSPIWMPDLDTAYLNFLFDLVLKFSCSNFELSSLVQTGTTADSLQSTFVKITPTVKISPTEPTPNSLFRIATSHVIGPGNVSIDAIGIYLAVVSGIKLMSKARTSRWSSVHSHWTAAIMGPETTV